VPRGQAERIEVDRIALLIGDAQEGSATVSVRPGEGFPPGRDSDRAQAAEGVPHPHPGGWPRAQVERIEVESDRYESGSAGGSAASASRFRWR
jgi:hypothetical protein